MRSHAPPSKTDRAGLRELFGSCRRPVVLFVPTSARKGPEELIAKVEDESIETGKTESNFGERWGKRSRLTIVSEEFRVGSGKSLLGLFCGAFSRDSGRVKKLLTTDK